MKAEELAVIKERASKYEVDMAATLSNEYRITKVDVPKLVAEVERLRSAIWRISDYCDMSIEETSVYVNGEDDE